MVHDHILKQTIETRVLEVGATDALGEKVEADDAGVVGDGGVEGGVVEEVFEPVEDVEFGEGEGEGVCVGGEAGRGRRGSRWSYT